jgi:phosphoglycolate phosphatase-like HAD superfamily hydrolase
VKNVNEFRYFVFDFDGTLVDSNEVKEKTFFEVVSGLYNGIDIMKLTLDHCKKDRYQIFDYFKLTYSKTFPDKANKINVDDLLNKYSCMTDLKVSQVKEIEGARELLIFLKKKEKKIFLNSLTPYENLIKIINKKKWTKFFNGIYGSPESKLNNLYKIKKKVKAKEKDFLIIGDNSDDKKSAEDFGASFYGVGSKIKINPKKNLLKDLINKI